MSTRNDNAAAIEPSGETEGPLSRLTVVFSGLLQPPYRQLSQFAGNLATCLAAGVGMEQGIKSSGRSLARTRYGSALEVARERVAQGNELSAALAARRAVWPPFLIPYVKAGEQSGRLDESLRYLEERCRMLDRPARAVQRVWLMPLGIVVFSTLLQTGILLFVDPAQAFWRLAGAMQGYLTLAMFLFFWVAPPFRPIVDAIKLTLPGLKFYYRESGASNFFGAMAMLYESGGFRVETMIRFAAESISNTALRNDVLVAAKEIEAGASIAEAFERPRYLTPAEKQAVKVGDLSGTLEGSFARNSDEAGERLSSWLKFVEFIAVRVAMGLAVLAVGGVVQTLVWTWLL